MVTLGSAAVVAAVALLVPLALRLARLPVPSVVVEILAGIVVGPQLLDWAQPDGAVRVLSVLGLAFLLFLAGLEIDFGEFRGRVLLLTTAGFTLSFALAVAVGEAFGAADLVASPLLVAVILSATSLGIILPVLADAGQLGTPFGRVVVVGASLAEVVPIVLLSLLFSGRGGFGARVTLLAVFLVFVVVLTLSVLAAERSGALSRALSALQETTAEIRVRAVVALLLLLAALAARFGLEAILGAFLAGAAVRLVDRDEQHPLLRVKVRAVGFGVFVPFFFVATGMALDVRSLVGDAATVARVPLFLVALVLVRAGPALLYRPLAERGAQVVAAGLLQATSLSIPVVAGSIGVQLGLIRPANYAALVAAGLLSVVLFPLVAVPLLRPPPTPA